MLSVVYVVVVTEYIGNSIVIILCGAMSIPSLYIELWNNLIVTNDCYFGTKILLCALY